jgi:serine/threonine-protein kinase
MFTLLKPGDVCDGYLVERLLGTGRTSEVWAARKDGGAPCAFKLMTVEGKEKDKVRFAQEGEALVRVRHPGIVRILAAGVWQGKVWLALEQVEGETLAQRARRTRGAAQPTLEDLIDWMMQLGEALAAAHERGVVHRDLDAGNVMITPEGRVRLLDFGKARLEVWGLKTTHDLQLSKNVAPELLKGAKTSPAMDVYGFGFVLYELIAGVHPIADGDVSLPDLVKWHMKEEARPLGEVAPWAPADLVALTHAMMAKDPAHRPPGMRAILATLQRINAGLATDVLQVVRSLPRPGSVPAMAPTVPMAVYDASACATAAASAPASSSQATSSYAASSSVPPSHAASSPAPAPPPVAAERVALYPACPATLVSAVVPPHAELPPRLPQPAAAPPVPADLRTSDSPVETGARRSRVASRGISVAAVVVAAFATLALAGWFVVTRAGTAATATPGPGHPVPAARPSAIAPPAASPAPTLAPTASASATASAAAAAPAKPPPAKAKGLHPAKTAPARNRIFGAEP